MNTTNNLNGSASAVISVGPITLKAPERGVDLQLRVSAPVAGKNLAVILFAHGFGSSMDAYTPLVNYWAANGFVVIQPTFLDSRTLLANPKADHGEAVQAFLADPRKLVMWKLRVDDMKHILTELETIISLVPTLKERVDIHRLAVAGHSFGAQTAGVLMGSRVYNPDGSLGEDLSDPRIKAGVLLSAGGAGGDALSLLAAEHFPSLNQNYDRMTTPSLVVAGDNDHSPLTVLGPEWFTGAYHLSPGADTLFTVYGGEHMLGGISGYLVRETSDENPDRVATVQRVSTAYLRRVLYDEKEAWEKVCDDETLSQVGKIDNKFNAP